jgi:broad specificity phosphatase PhoE
MFLKADKAYASPLTRAIETAFAALEGDRFTKTPR